MIVPWREDSESSPASSPRPSKSNSKSKKRNSTFDSDSDSEDAPHPLVPRASTSNGTTKSSVRPIKKKRKSSTLEVLRDPTPDLLSPSKSPVSSPVKLPLSDTTQMKKNRKGEKSKVYKKRVIVENSDGEE